MKSEKLLPGIVSGIIHGSVIEACNVPEVRNYFIKKY